MTPTSRRRYLAAAGSGLAAALAGCIGGGSSDISSLSTDDRPARGNEDAPVRMAVFSDFSCPHCARFERQVRPQIFEQYVVPGDVLYFHVDFPIPVNETWSPAVASAARAVFDEAGNDAFWSFFTAMFDRQGQYSYDVIEMVADEAGGVGAAAREAAQEESYSDEVESDRSMGEDWGVRATPAPIVADKSVPVEGPPDEIFKNIADAIESQL
ncbi:DsbA family protein [Halovenus rubra]|uniref:DsbA family protein n=2 Tax=Halovenus rubra TaxID=869890 RepID=A0ACC7DZ36_9EURY|nr:thioredoxin domain-containing protein [Halovenus rubra]